jgi:NAD(P)-dependent dehydrogenase (short-subunit alcohol dehydrogenase family)
MARLTGAMTWEGLLSQKVVLVSGGTQALGAACVREAVDQGAEGRGFHRSRRQATSALATDLPGRTKYLRTDVAVVSQVRDSVNYTVARYGRVDCVVNVAGLTDRGTLLDTSTDLLDKHVAVNLRAPFFMMQAAITAMVAGDVVGTVVNIITTAAHGGQPYNAPYVAARAGLVGLTKNVAYAHRWDKVRVNGLAIGWTDTPAEDRLQRASHAREPGWQTQIGESLPMGRLGDPRQIAAMVCFLLSPRSGVVTGTVIDWDQTIIGAFD